MRLSLPEIHHRLVMLPLAAALLIAVTASAALAQDKGHRNGHGAHANDVGATAFGNDANANHRRSVAVGHDNDAYGHDGVAIGHQAHAIESNSIAIGEEARTGDVIVRTLGHINSLGELENVQRIHSGRGHANAIAIGNDAEALAPESIAIGMGSRTRGNRSLAIGFQANVALASDGIAIGSKSYTAKRDATAFGTEAKGFGDRSVALGRRAVAGINGRNGFTDSVAIGHLSQARGARSVAIGEAAVALGHDAIAIGRLANTENAHHATAIGVSARASATAAIAIGRISQATGEGAISIGGNDAAASAEHAIAIGQAAQAGGIDSIAFGHTARAHHDSIATANAIALGEDSHAAANSAIAIGDNARALHRNAVALGNTATSRIHQRMLGSRIHHYRLPGINTQASRNARGRNPVQLVTTDASGNLAGDGGEIIGRVTTLERYFNIPHAQTARSSSASTTQVVGSHESSETTTTTQANTPDAPDIPIFEIPGGDPFSPVTPDPTPQPGTGGDGSTGGDSPALVPFSPVELPVDVAPVVETRITPLQESADNITARSAQQSDAIQSNRDDIKRNTDGIALAMALYAPPLMPHKSYSVTLGYGHYEEGNALGVSGSYRFNETVFFSLSGGIGLNASDAIGGRLSFTLLQ